ncbi:WbqC family protein [Ruegeria atlantica]|uniref:WbqC-like protein family protein n=1 Tax=Ruegeria atlantica TaxID=81569 RepID=A0A0P1F470_9RHOB|nr:WbqC family protein [Ruegeria atlantica]CUH49826.1 WbqC-like protein family protein [Ruegeria atlantica]
MRLGVMQPYFFPNLAHFALIAATDKWIVFDVTQYARKTWISRNRILHPTSGWQYVSVPLARSTIHMNIHEAKLADPTAFHQSLRGKLDHYKKSAPYHAEVLDVIDRSFSDLKDDALTTLNVGGLTAVCDYLNIPFDFQVCSSLALDFPGRMGPGDWAPFISRKLNATCYINPAGGRDLFEPLDFTNHDIDLRFARFGEFTYKTPGYDFMPGLSIIDVLMWNDPQVVRKALFDLNVLLPPESCRSDTA